MASKLQQLQTKACQASKFVAQHGTAYYKLLLEQNKLYIQVPPTVEKCNLLAKQLFYTRLARSSKRKGRSLRVHRIHRRDFCCINNSQLFLDGGRHSGRKWIMSSIYLRTGKI